VIDIAGSIAADREGVAVRDPVIDVARGIAILLVVLGHNGAINRWSPELVDVIFLFHVPLFFLLSGYVFRREGWNAVLAKLTRRLLVPCFAAALLIGAIKSFSRDEAFEQMLVGVAWATGQTLAWSHLWFLPTLFLALLVTQLAGYLFGERPAAWTAGVVMAIALAAVTPESSLTLANYSFPAPVGLPWGVDVLTLCLVFVFAGQLLRNSPWLAKRVRSTTVGVAAAILFAWSVTVASVDLNMRMFTPFFPALLAAVSGCVIALNVAEAICRSAALARLVAFVGRHTMPIFLLHVSIQKALLKLDARFELPMDHACIKGLLTAALAIALAVIVERHVIAPIKPLRYLFLPERAR